jgi:hypothetical protein
MKRRALEKAAALRKGEGQGARVVHERAGVTRPFQFTDSAQLLALKVNSDHDVAGLPASPACTFRRRWCPSLRQATDTRAFKGHGLAARVTLRRRDALHGSLESRFSRTARQLLLVRAATAVEARGPRPSRSSDPPTTTRASSATLPSPQRRGGPEGSPSPDRAGGGGGRRGGGSGGTVVGVAGGGVAFGSSPFGASDRLCALRRVGFGSAAFGSSSLLGRRASPFVDASPASAARRRWAHSSWRVCLRGGLAPESGSSRPAP